MTKVDFLNQLAEILVTDPKELQPDVPLIRFKGWDSMGKMAVLTLIDSDVGVVVPHNWLAECKSVGHILQLVGPKFEPPHSPSGHTYSD